MELRLTEHRVDRRARLARAPVDEIDEVLADLEADIVRDGSLRGALEQELRVGTADLDLDRPAPAAARRTPRNCSKCSWRGLTCSSVRARGAGS